MSAVFFTPSFPPFTGIKMLNHSGQQQKTLLGTAGPEWGEEEEDLFCLEREGGSEGGNHDKSL